MVYSIHYDISFES